MTSAPLSALALVELNHFTIRCRPSELEALRAFYREVLGMREGPRPNFDFEGHWMYVGERATVHLAAIAASDTIQAGGSGFDHVSISAKGLDAARERMTQLGVAYEELPVPGWPLHQIFLHDPVGSKIELTFEVSDDKQ